MLTCLEDSSPAHHNHDRETPVRAYIEGARPGAQPLCLGGIEIHMAFARRTTEGVVGGQCPDSCIVAS